MPSSEIHQKARGFAVTARVALINQLPPDRLTAVVQLLEFLAQPAQTVSNLEETVLLEVRDLQLNNVPAVGCVRR